MPKSARILSSSKRSRLAPVRQGWIELTGTERRRLGIAMSNAVVPYCTLTGIINMSCAEDVRDKFARQAIEIGVHLPVTEPDFANKAEQRAWFVYAGRALRMAGKPGVGALDKRITYIADLLNLDTLERDILGVAARRLLFPQWEALWSMVDTEHHIFSTMTPLATLCGHPKTRVASVLLESSKLISTGLLSDITHGSLSLSNWAQRLLRANVATDTAMRRLLIPSAESSALVIDDFKSLTGCADIAQRLISSAFDCNGACNILLYGAPGMGKTEFAKLLASATHANPILVGVEDEDGGEPTSDERINHLRLLRHLNNSNERMVFIIDEAEDLFSKPVGKYRSKLWLNRLVEQGRGVHIWIVNDADELGEVIVRRMDMAIYFDKPDRAARTAIAKKLIAKMSIKKSGQDDTGRAARLAQVPASPAIYRAALKTASRVGGDVDLAIRLTEDLVRAVGEHEPAGSNVELSRFDPKICETDTNLEHLARQLNTLERQRGRGPVKRGQGWNLLLSGPPGTGKSAFAAYLAQQLGLDLQVITGAQLQSPYVGQTEQKIAAAFRKASETPSVLLIDEIDSFLLDRTTLQRSWEVSVVNAMLTEMEREQVRFVATTNLVDRLDTASARRFSLHIKYQPMRAEQARLLFEQCFGTRAPRSLDHVQQLTPGDFAQAVKRLRFSDVAGPQQLVDWLSQASEGRGVRQSMGFV